MLLKNKRKILFFIFFSLTMKSFALTGNIKNIEFEGEHPIKNILQKNAKDHLNENIDKEKIVELMNEFTTILINSGYPTSSISFKEGNINNGDLVFKINAGKIDKIYIQGKDDEKSKKKILSAFGNYEGEILKIHNLDQGIENLNVRGSNHLMEIQASEKEGYSNIVIKEKEERKEGYFDLSIDNIGTKINEANITGIYSNSNILGYNDKLYFSYSTLINKEILKNNRHIINLAYEIPYRNNNFSYDVNIIKTNGYIKGKKSEIKNNNLTVTQKFKVATNVHRTSKSKTNLFGSLNVITVDSRIADQKISVQSKTKVDLTLGLNHKDKVLGGDLNFNFTYDRGIRKTGSDKFKSELRYNIQKPLKNRNILEYDVKMSASVIRGRENVSLGGESTVRGYNETNIYGNMGAFMQNTLSYNIKKEKYSVIPYLGMDMGATENGSIFGITAGIKANIGKFSSRISYSKGLKSIDKQKRENIFDFNLAYSF